MKNVKKHFNIIDFVVVVVIIGCIAGVAVRYNFVNRIIAGDDSESVIVYFTAKELNPEEAGFINKKNEFVCAATNNSLGNPKFIAFNNSKYIYSDANGKPAEGENASKKDIRLCFEVTGVKSEEGFLLNGTQRIVPGDEMVIKSNEVQLSVIITEIRQQFSS